MLKNLFWNQKERRVRALWRLLLLFILGTPAIYIVVYALYFPLAIILLLVHLRMALPLLQLVNTMLASAVATLVLTWLVVRFLDHDRFKHFGYHLNKNWWLDFIFGSLLGVFLNSALVLVMWLAGWISVSRLFFNQVTTLPFIVVLGAWLLNFLLVALFEETFARSYPLRNFAQVFNTPSIGSRRAIVLSWLLTSLLFGFGHYSNPHVTLLEMISISMAGLLMGLGYILTGNLGFALGLHMTWDFTQGNIYGFPIAGQTPNNLASLFIFHQHGPIIWTGGIAGPDGGLLSICAFLLGILILLAYIRWRYGKIQLFTPLALYKNEQTKATKLNNTTSQAEI
ncbi:CAAX amino protease [Dictyobacter alpinus]|uniref:CAAX amino protease n=1 Tax=Dictyobacter alpinus TaxID=2014873 RepID=A0A402BKL0_9CHLR|nr:type II CAAX endopeptidase family protein [Dictyobacter alpinus]GCE31869.1 CAAX amino protease [Dictyobacter alpinus]